MNRATISGKLVLNSKLSEVGRAEAALLDAARKHHFQGADQFAIKLALEEALANAIKHGNASDPAKRIVFEFEVDPERVRFSVEDEGGGFDPADVPDPTLDENLEKPSGRGVMLMRAYMNEVDFNDAGNRVTLVKRRSNSSAVSNHRSG